MTLVFEPTERLAPYLDLGRVKRSANGSGRASGVVSSVQRQGRSRQKTSWALGDDMAFLSLSRPVSNTITGRLGSHHI